MIQRIYCCSLCVVFISLSVSVHGAEYGGGSGMADDPYRISLPVHLYQLHDSPGDYDKHFVLTDDVDMSGQHYTTAVIAPDTILGGSFDGPRFTGTFDGNSHSILNLNIAGKTGGNFLGLFGCIDGDGLVKDLAMENAAIAGGDGSHRAGCLVGMLGGSLQGGEIKNSHSSGSVMGPDQGVSFYFGGLVGNNYTGSIINSGSTASVYGKHYIGGLVGLNGSALLKQCRASGSVSGVGNIGGLVGGTNHISGRIISCYAEGDVVGRGSDPVGGLIGGCHSMLINCYSTGRVTSDSALRVGGLLGQNEGIVSNCFWNVQTSGLATSAGGEGITTAEMMQSETFFSWHGFEWILDEGRDFPRLAWEEADGIMFPFDPQAPGSGTASDPYRISNAQQIQWLGRTAAVWDKHFHVESDIELGHMDASDLAICFAGVFDGQGHIISGLTIHSNIDHLGLFRTLFKPGQIRNLHLEGVRITGDASSHNRCVGALVGSDYAGTIADCSVTGSVNGFRVVGGLIGSGEGGTIYACSADVSVTGRPGESEHHGGLVGYIQAGAHLSNCYAIGDITGYRSTGGLVGRTGSTVLLDRCFAIGSVNGYSACGGLVGSNGRESAIINDCYARGSVTAQRGVGGLAGVNSGTITNCYSTGPVSGSQYVGGLIGRNFEHVLTSFWDMETSGIISGGDGTAKTTSQMRTMTTFTDAGWDFETPIWIMEDGVGYPFLKWQNNAPIAVAGDDAVVYAGPGGVAVVALNGLGSSDPDGHELSYRWLLDGAEIAVGAGPLVELPVGEHLVELVVSDGWDETSDTVVVEVVAPIETSVRVIPRVITRKSRGRNVLAIMQLPEGMESSDIDDGYGVVFEPGDVQARLWRVLVDDDEAILFAMFDRDKVIDALGGEEDVQMNVICRLVSGRYLYGTQAEGH